MDVGHAVLRWCLFLSSHNAALVVRISALGVGAIPQVLTRLIVVFSSTCVLDRCNSRAALQDGPHFTFLGQQSWSFGVIGGISKVGGRTSDRSLAFWPGAQAPSRDVALSPDSLGDRVGWPGLLP